MMRVLVKTGEPYEVLSGRGLLQEAGSLVRELLPPCRALIVPVQMGTCIEYKLPVDELEAFFALGMEESV